MNGYLIIGMQNCYLFRLLICDNNFSSSKYPMIFVNPIIIAISKDINWINLQMIKCKIFWSFKDLKYACNDIKVIRWNFHISWEADD